LSAEPEVQGFYNWIHSTAHGQLTFPFYRDYKASYCAQTNDAHL